MPYQLSGRKAISTNRQTWAGFDEVLAKYKQIEPHLALDGPGVRAGYAGIGYVFAKDDLFVGVDLDNCRDPETGVLKPWTNDQRKPWKGDVPDPAVIVSTLDSYAENQ